MWASSVGSAHTPPDLPGVTRAALEEGVDAAIVQQRRLAQWLVAQGTPLDHVVSGVLLWEEVLLRRLARDAVEDIFTAAAALNRFTHGLVLLVAEGYWETVRQERDQIRRGLDDADRLKTELISMVSHDLQTPLTTIQGAVVSALDPDVDDEQRTRFLRLIQQNAERLSRLISQILDLSSIEARAMHLDVGELDLSATARRLVDGILPVAPVRLDVPKDLPAVRADRDAVERILVNLIDNAVRFSPKGEPVLVEASVDDDFVEIRVCDRGAGIPDGRRGGLFSKFYQVDASASGRRTGTGLGLAIVRGLAEAMGGAAGYRPNAPAGSVFWVRLPVAEEATERVG
jgi:two-component system sensor histidine kinase KdpD